MEKYIETPSSWGTTRNTYITMGSGRLAVILPGLRYTNMAPLLYYSMNIAVESGYDTLAVEYGFQRGGGEFVPDTESLERLAKEAKGTIDICLEKKRYSEILFIGKSLGTLVQTYLKNEYAAYPQRHVFLTPLPECIDVIKQRECMVVIGTKDRVFKKEHIDGITGLENVTLITVDGADHSMEKGDYKEDLKTLFEVCGNVYAFINKKNTK